MAPNKKNDDNSSSKIKRMLEEITIDKEEHTKMSILEINDYFFKHGIGILLILFSFPMAIPLPYPPGFTTILGIPLMFYSVHMILGHHYAWLPTWVASKKIKVAHLRFALGKCTKFFVFIEKLTKPRFLFLTTNFSIRILGIIILLCAISIILPIWLGNAIPSLGIFLISIGLIHRDGLFIFSGIIISIIGLIVSTAVVLLGVTIVKAVIFKFFALN